MVVDVGRYKEIKEEAIRTEIEGDLKYSEMMKEIEADDEASELKIALYSQDYSSLLIPPKVREIITELDDPISAISLMMREHA